METTVYTLTADDVATINAARAVVRKAFAATPQSSADGMLYAIADQYGEAAFRLLNWSKHNGAMDISEAELHYGPEPV